MCGVLAYTGKNAFDAQACLDKLSHRGPDAGSLDSQFGVVLGHRRLSIIDTHERSNQPFQSASGKTRIVFNGEIYNFRELKETLRQEGVTFRTNGDTEVIVEGYERHGVSFFGKMRGMWAFVIHDVVHNRLVLARDSFGIKPLIYTTHQDSLYIASELRCLKGAIPLEPDPESYATFFTLGYFIAPRTPYKNVRRVMPGEVLGFDLTHRTFSSLAFVSRYAKGQESKAGSVTDIIEEALTDSVEAHYVSDVPVSILLSGGTDSSIIAALSKKIGKQPSAYHVAIEGSADTAYAKAVATHLGLDLTVVELSNQSLVEQYRAIGHVLDEPTGDVSILPTTLVYKSIKGHARVVLSGEGGDELFGGYLRHALLAKHAKGKGRKRLHSHFDSLIGTGTFNLSVVNPLVERIQRGLLTHGLQNDLLGAYMLSTRITAHGSGHAEAELATLLRENGGEISHPALVLDLLAYLPNDLLPKSDIASMASSIEARVPFVDRVFAEAVRQATKEIPPQGDKLILKQVLERFLPKNLVYREKTGFGVPFTEVALEEITRDFHEAVAFHQNNQEAFGVPERLISALDSRQKREIVVKKFPRLAFALISNWRVFTL